MANGDENKIRVDLRTNEKTKDNYKQYIDSLREQVIGDTRLYVKTRLDLMEAMIRVIMADHGVTPNQMTVCEDRMYVVRSDGPRMWIEIDKSIPPLEYLVPEEFIQPSET